MKYFKFSASLRIHALCAVQGKRRQNSATRRPLFILIAIHMEVFFFCGLRSSCSLITNSIHCMSAALVFCIFCYHHILKEDGYTLVLHSCSRAVCSESESNSFVVCSLYIHVSTSLIVNSILLLLFVIPRVTHKKWIYHTWRNTLKATEQVAKNVAPRLDRESSVWPLWSR